MINVYSNSCESRRAVVEELARAKYQAMMSNPITRIQLLREAVKMIHKEVLAIQAFAIDEEGSIFALTQDEAKSYFFEYEFICLESFMCDSYLDRYSPMYHYPRILSI
jgi:hypothetical protein